MTVTGLRVLRPGDPCPAPNGGAMVVQIMEGRDRPEQERWWEGTVRCFDGDVEFCESDDVDTSLAGGCDLTDPWPF